MHERELFALDKLRNKEDRTRSIVTYCPHYNSQVRINLCSYHSKAMEKNLNKNMEENDICKIHLHFGCLRACPTLSYLSGSVFEAFMSGDA